LSDKKGLGWMNRLWQFKFYILLGVAIAILAYATYYYHGQSEDRAADLVQKGVEYDALGMQYANLTGEHETLIASHNNLTELYTNLSYNYSSLISNTSSIRSDYDSMKSAIGNFTERGGPVIALYYHSYRLGSGNNQKLYVQAIIYNVGDNKASSATIHCRVLYMGQPNLNDQTFTNIAPLDKRNYTWEFDTMSQLDTVWVTYS